MVGKVFAILFFGVFIFRLEKTPAMFIQRKELNGDVRIQEMGWEVERKRDPV